MGGNQSNRKKNLNSKPPNRKRETTPLSSPRTHGNEKESVESHNYFCSDEVQVVSWISTRRGEMADRVQVPGFSPSYGLNRVDVSSLSLRGNKNKRRKKSLY